MTIDNLVKGINNIPPKFDKIQIYKQFYANMYMRNLEANKPAPILVAIDYGHKVDRGFKLYTHLYYKEIKGRQCP